MSKPALTDRNLAYRPAAETQARYRVLYGGAGSGKSVFTAQDYIAKLTREKRRLLCLRKYKSTVYGSVFTLFRDILEAMGRLGDMYKNEQRMSYRFPNGSEILTAGLDDVQKLKSLAQPTDLWIEEATELDFPHGEAEEPDLAQIDLRLRGVDDGQITITFNPRLEAKKIFDYLGVPTGDLPTRNHRLYDEGRVYVQHTTYKDNQWVGPGYVSVFRKLGGVMQAVYERGELVAIDAPDQLIKYEWVKAAFERKQKDAWTDGRQRLAIDVARFGDDETVLGRFDGYALLETEAYEQQSTTQAGHRALSLAREHSIPAELIAVDVVGVGGGTADTLADAGYDVTEIVAGAKPVPVKEWDEMPRLKDGSPAFNMLRSQMWWYLREQMQAGTVAVCVGDEAKRKLQEDLLAPRYRFGQEKRREVEPKTGRNKNWGIKQRLGRSPDYGDMLAMGIFAEHAAPQPSYSYGFG